MFKSLPRDQPSGAALDSCVETLSRAVLAWASLSSCAILANYSGPRVRDYHLLLDEQADLIYATTRKASGSMPTTARRYRVRRLSP